MILVDFTDPDRITVQPTNDPTMLATIRASGRSTFARIRRFVPVPGTPIDITTAHTEEVFEKVASTSAGDERISEFDILEAGLYEIQTLHGRKDWFASFYMTFCDPEPPFMNFVIEPASLQALWRVFGAPHLHIRGKESRCSVNISRVIASTQQASTLGRATAWEKILLDNDDD